jgi:hypothetical protein
MQSNALVTQMGEKRFEDGDDDASMKLPQVVQRTEQLCDGSLANETIDLYSTILPGYSPVLITPKDQGLGEERNLCRWCSEIDLDDLFSRQSNTFDHVNGEWLSLNHELDIASCPLCNLIHYSSAD